MNTTKTIELRITLRATKFKEMLGPFAVWEAVGAHDAAAERWEVSVYTDAERHEPVFYRSYRRKHAAIKMVERLEHHLGVTAKLY